jgi:hypothetical protein
MQGPEDEVVRHIGADLLSRLTEVPGRAARQRAIELGDDGSRPRRRQLGGEEPGRPAAEVDGTAAETVGQTGEAAGHVCEPGQAPDLGARAEVNADRWGYAQPQHRQVLHVLGEYEAACLQH